jgi:hypothetical protein
MRRILDFVDAKRLLPDSCSRRVLERRHNGDVVDTFRPTICLYSARRRSRRFPCPFARQNCESMTQSIAPSPCIAGCLWDMETIEGKMVNARIAVRLGVGISARGLPLPVGFDHRRRHIARLAKRCSTARSGVSAAPAVSSAISHGVVWTGARSAPGVILIAAGLNNDRSDAGGSQRSLDLALIFRLHGLVWQIGLGGRRRSHSSTFSRKLEGIEFA